MTRRPTPRRKPHPKPRPTGRTSHVANRPAFTLIELLVTLSIVAVLLAILLPVIAKARSTALRARCLSNARQIATAVSADAAANGSRLPENRTLVAPGEHVTWRHRYAQAGLVPMGEDVWACPAHDGEPRSELGAFDRDTKCVGDVPSSYALNGHVLWRRETEARTEDRPDTAIRRPSHTILIAETRAAFPDLRVSNVVIATDDGKAGVYAYWHAGDATYAFQDGHAETISLLDTGNPDCRWHNGRDFNVNEWDEDDASFARIHDHPDWQYLAHEVYLTNN